MNEITKLRLKQVNRLLKIGLLTFCWLMCAVGITAYSVYWLRQNANYVQEVQKREISSKLANTYSSGDWDYSYRTKSIGDYTKWLYYENNTDGYKSYFDVDFNNWPVDDMYPYAIVQFTGDFGIRVNGQLTRYTRLDFDFVYSASDRCFRCESIILKATGVPSYTIYHSSGEVLTTTTLLFKNVTRVVTSYFEVYQDNLGLFNFYFENVFNYADSIQFNFNDMFDYTRLFSYQTFSNGVFKYNGTTAVTPVDIFYDCKLTFESNGQLFSGVRFYCSAIGYVADSNGNVTEYGNLLASSTTDYYLALTDIEYINYRSNTSLKVASLGVLEYKTTYNGQNVSSLPVYLTMNGFNWIDKNYKYLNIASNTLDNSTEVSINYINASVCPFLNLTSYKALTFEVSDIITGSQITDIGLSNVFTLMSSAFTGLAGLMAIQIIPGITIGLLCFIPLIVTVILVVLKLVKK